MAQPSHSLRAIGSGSMRLRAHSRPDVEIGDGFGRADCELITPECPALWVGQSVGEGRPRRAAHRRGTAISRGNGVPGMV